MLLNHPKTIPPPLVHGKIVFHETGPWCQKVWGPLNMLPYMVKETLQKSYMKGIEMGRLSWIIWGSMESQGSF